MNQQTAPHMEMANHPSSLVTIAWFLLFLTIIHQSFSARNLGNSSQGNGDHHANLAISFSMPDVLNQKHPSSMPVTTEVNGQIPFSKPLGFFPPIGGIPLANMDAIPITGLPSQTIDLDGISMSFPAIATLQELELGTVTPINEDIYEGSVFGSSLLGKAQGIYVASSEDGSSHMMAMTASFIGNGFKDSLRFFGVHRSDVNESHVAVIGGTSKYQNANGFATVKSLNISSSLKSEESEEAYRLLLFNVYLG